MNFIKIVCPKCNAEAKLSLVDTSYVGPRRCWKCHEVFTITIENNRVTSCEPLSQEEFERLQEAQKIAEKAGGHITFTRKEQPAIPSKAMEPPRGGIDFSNTNAPDLFQKAEETSRGGISFSRQDEPTTLQKAAENSRGGIDFVKRDEPAIPQRPPEKRQDIIRPVGPKEPPMQAKPEGPVIFPPDRIRTFIPLEGAHEKPEKPQQTKNQAEKKRDYATLVSPTSPEGPGNVFPPDRIRIFVPLEDIDEEPKKP